MIMFLSTLILKCPVWPCGTIVVGLGSGAVAGAIVGYIVAKMAVRAK